MVLLKLILLFCASIYVVVAKYEQYDGHSLFMVNVENVDQAVSIKRLQNDLQLFMESEPQPGKLGEILVPIKLRENFKAQLTTYGIKYKIVVENIKELLDLEDQKLAAAKSKPKRPGTALPYDEIHTLPVVDQYLARLANEYPSLVTLVSAGKSFEGRDMNYLKISTTNFQDRRKPIVFLQSLIGPREWITLPASLFAIEKLVINVSETDLVNDIDWIIMPVANPDGYVFTYVETGFRFWNKNRATGYMPGNLCRGVDLTKNFDIFWGTLTTDFPCDYFFHGGGPFSEPETRNIRDIFHQYADRLELFIDIQSWGSFILYGFGNGQLTPNALSLHVTGVNMAQAIDRVKWNWKRDYTVGNVFLAHNPTSGIPSDYAQSIGIPYSYTYLLPTHHNIVNASMIASLVDPEFIEQAGFETWEGIKVGARAARRNFSQRTPLFD